MDDYKRFVSYIYNYEMKEKKNNIGFARVETKDSHCKFTLHVQIKKSIMSGNFPVYGVIRSASKIKPVLLGTIKFRNGKGDAQFLFHIKDVGNAGVLFSTIGGIIIYLTDDKYYGTEWDNKPLVFQELLLNDTNKNEESEYVYENVSINNETGSNKPDEDSKMNQHRKMQEKDVTAAEIIAEAIDINEETTECSVEVEINSDEATPDREIGQENTKIQKEYATQPETVGAERMRQKTAVNNQEIYFEPYTLNDLYERFAYTVTDDFMIHGYHRFGHLGVLHRNNRYILGVPGIFCKREEMFANRSGFHNFCPKGGTPLKYGDFGYWYTSIEYLK